mmetsp:Transcript_29515/g.84896  ORF Transcript_29515/g.84896 Transcript_29515/m.84896 type:complete len:203 (-) Transcript_29515:180-788(-)
MASPRASSSLCRASSARTRLPRKGRKRPRAPRPHPQCALRACTSSLPRARSARSVSPSRLRETARCWSRGRTPPVSRSWPGRSRACGRPGAAAEVWSADGPSGACGRTCPTSSWCRSGPTSRRAAWRRTRPTRPRSQATTTRVSWSACALWVWPRSRSVMAWTTARRPRGTSFCRVASSSGSAWPGACTTVRSSRSWTSARR